MKRLIIAVSIAALLTLAVLSGFSRHIVWERDIDTQLIWSAHEAYFIAARQREGWSGNLIEFGWQAARVYAGLAAGRTDRRRWLEVTRITASDTHKTIVPDSTAVAAGIFDEHIYLAVDGTLTKWVDDGYVTVSQEEQRRFYAERKGSGEFRDVDGWSIESNIVRGAPGSSSYSLLLDGRAIKVEVNQDPSRRSVTVRFVSGTTATVYDVSTEPAEVNLAKYRSLFEDEFRNVK